DDDQKAKLDRSWDQLHYVSHDAPMLVDAFEQLWQYATQDADPKVFEPLRKPIQERAAAFRQRLIDTEPRHVQAVVEFANRAYRLSYFLWSSMPDPELAAVAAAGKLHDPGILTAQTRRMLGDARVRRLAIEFACQWLHLHDFDTLDEKSERHFPTFGGLQGAM